MCESNPASKVAQTWTGLSTPLVQLRNTWLLTDPYNGTKVDYCCHIRTEEADDPEPKPTVLFFDHRGIVATHDDTVNTYPAVAVSVRVFREPDFYFYNIAVWMGLFSLLAIGTGAAVQHTEAADRIAVSLTLVLTAAAYKFVILSMVPRVSYLTLIDQYVNEQGIILALVTVENSMIGYISGPRQLLYPGNTTAEADEGETQGYNENEGFKFWALLVIFILWILSQIRGVAKAVRVLRGRTDAPGEFDFLPYFGLKWRIYDAKPEGAWREIKDRVPAETAEALEEALASGVPRGRQEKRPHIRFDEKQWKRFQIRDLREGEYVKLGDKYYPLLTTHGLQPDKYYMPVGKPMRVRHGKRFLTQQLLHGLLGRKQPINFAKLDPSYVDPIAATTPRESGDYKSASA